MTLAVAEVMPSRADGSGFDLEFIDYGMVVAV